jgi:hypothetical protein
VVAPGFLQNPEVRQWLGGVEPAWTVLDFASYVVLRQEPLPGNEAIRIIPDLTEADLAGSAVTRTARKLLQRAVDGGGLKLTATGNEPDVLPIHIVRLLLQETKLVRKRRDKLLLTRLGNKLLAPEQCGALQALLFHIALWRLNLGYFDRNPIESWPQNDIGVVLWSLSASANDWMPPDKLTRLCTVPRVGLLESAWDVGTYAMETRILRPLVWFGLLESRREGEARLGSLRLYRKLPLFDQFLEFHVKTEPMATRH